MQHENLLWSLGENGRWGMITSFVYPPIPIRWFDWCAYLDGYEPGDPIGWGKTEAEAILDLEDLLNE